MRFFLGFDGVPVALPLLQRPASIEPWRAIRGSCRRPHKQPMWRVAETDSVETKRPCGTFHNHIQIHIICTLMYPFAFTHRLTAEKKLAQWVYVCRARVTMTLETTFTHQVGSAPAYAHSLFHFAGVSSSLYRVIRQKHHRTIWTLS